MASSTRSSSALLWIIRILVSVLFMFSGLIKANDPMGFGYKLIEYFEVFGLTFLNDFAVAIAIALCSIEIILGFLLLFGFWSRQTAWGLLLLILFFTFLTFYSAFFNVVSSCGCFGDAIPLTPWQSFAKDVVLLVLIGALFYFRDRLEPLIDDRYTQYILTVFIVVLSVGFGVYTYNFLPVVDFLPYKKGNHLPSLMMIPEGEELDVYQTIYQLRHKETGETRQVTDKEYLEKDLWKDEAWEIEGDPETKLIKKGYQIPIADLMISDAEGVDHTDEIVENPGYSLIIVAYDIEKANSQGLSQLNSLAREVADDFRIRTVLLTASSLEKVEEYTSHFELYTEVFHADAVPLKSMVRSNPGLMLLKDGTVIDKWHFHVLPSRDELAETYLTLD
jgi:uncharacterized membrane protein YphA (DoxX/SURF4 family)